MEQREAKRWKSHLRTVKLLDASKRVLVECHILDLSATGAKLRPQTDRPLPLDLYFHDEVMDVSVPATIVWNANGDIGIRFGPNTGGAP